MKQEMEYLKRIYLVVLRENPHYFAYAYIGGLDTFFVFLL